MQIGILFFPNTTQLDPAGPQEAPLRRRMAFRSQGRDFRGSRG
jgi:hypothetical protein